MRNYITLNGKNSNEINGLLIQELPPISKPQIRTEVEEIDGRDGDIVTKLGFAAYDKEFTVGLYKDFDINAIIAYFNSEGTVVFSNEPDKYYNYQIIDQIDFERLVRYRTATVRMHCQPFKYSNTEGARTLGNKGTASGEGSFITLDNTPEAQFSKIDPKGNAKQDGTPTPDSPVPVQTVTGENVVKIEGKNLAKIENITTTSHGMTYTFNEDGTITLNGTSDATSSQNATLDYPIHIKAGQIYTFSANNAEIGASVTVRLQKGNGQSGVFAPGTLNTANKIWSFSGTENADCCLQVRIASGITLNNFTFRPQLELGSTATAYEPYQGQEFEVNLGKNLLGLQDASATQQSGVSISVQNGTISLNGTASASFGVVVANLSEALRMTNGIDYAISMMTASGSASHDFDIQLRDGSDTNIFSINSSYLPASRNTFSGIGKKLRLYIASGTVFNNYKIAFQIERGSTATSFAPYFTPIELAKIGDYQDRIYKEDSKWYIEKQVGKINMADITGWSYSGSGALYALNFTTLHNAKVDEALSNIFVHDWTAWAGVGKFGITSSGNLWIMTGDASVVVSNVNTWLSDKNAVMYYVLATPTTTEITNETLISQLEALYNQAHAYKGRTHVTAIAQGSNAPHIIEAEVQRSSDGNITNNGNIVSKPTLTIYGSGNIGVSLNGYQILEITLGDEEYITIDTAAMEAYKDTLDNLKNRLVNGDYSKFALRPGSNMIEFSGTVSKCVISKYSRWL